MTVWTSISVRILLIVTGRMLPRFSSFSLSSNTWGIVLARGFLFSTNQNNSININISMKKKSINGKNICSGPSKPTFNVRNLLQESQHSLSLSLFLSFSLLHSSASLYENSLNTKREKLHKSLCSPPSVHSKPTRKPFSCDRKRA